MIGVRVGLLVAVGVAVWHEAHAQPSADVVAAVRGADARAQSAILVGISGQVYVPEAGVWKRKHLGGIALPVQGAVKSGRGVLFAVASRSPIYRYDNGVWHVDPLPNRGRAAIGSGKAPAIALGHHVYLLRGESWQLLGRAPAPIAAVAASSTTTAYALLANGRLQQMRKGAIRPVRLQLGPGDAVTTLIGGAGEVYAITKSGTLLWVRGLAASPVHLPPDLKGLQVQASGVGVRGALLAGVAGSTAVLAQARGGKVTRLHDLPPLATGDRVGAIYAGGGDVLVATRRGAVHVRAKKASAWQTGKVSLELPAGARRAVANPPARAR